MTEQEYLDYFEDLASKHKAILHTPEQPRFYVVHDNNRTEIEQKMRSGMLLPAVLVDQYFDDIDRTNDNYRLKIMGGISVLVKCRGQDPKDVRRARNEARKIVLQFINRMYFDCRNVRGSLVNRRITPSTRFQGDPTPVIQQTAAGWGYPFEWEMPTTVAVSWNDWTDQAA